MKNLKLIAAYIRRYFLYLFLVFMLNLISGKLACQQKSYEYGNMEWFHYYSDIAISEKWSWSNDGGIRFSDTFEQFSQYIVRTGIGYEVLPGLRVGAGFAQSGSFKSDVLSVMEYRPYQEASANEKYGRINVRNRLRIEERIFRKVPGTDIEKEKEFFFRFRYLLALSIPVYKLSATKPEKQLLLSLSDEIFLHAGKDVINSIFGQNRLMIGPVLQLNKSNEISLIYNYTFAGSSSPGEYVKLNILWLSIKQKFTLGKDKNRLN